jgi:MoxR-like ATPase
MLSIDITYPSRGEELDIAARPARAEVPHAEPVAKREDFLEFVEVVDSCPISPHVLEYAVSLAAASRPGEDKADAYVKRYVSWGVGPRATQHLVTAAKAAALLDGRPAPEVKDVRGMALPVLRHRIIPNYNALGEGIDSAAIVRHLLDTVAEGAGS